MYIKEGNYVDSIEVWWLDPQGNYHYSGRAGGQGGFGRNIPIGPNVTIAAAVGRSGSMLDGIEFLGSDGEVVRAQDGVGYFGGAAGGYPWGPDQIPGKIIAGFETHSGKYVDRIAMIFYTP
jgi:hypothetical protein